MAPWPMSSWKWVSVGRGKHHTTTEMDAYPSKARPKVLGAGGNFSETVTHTNAIVQITIMCHNSKLSMKLWKVVEGPRETRRTVIAELWWDISKVRHPPDPHLRTQPKEDPSHCNKQDTFLAPVVPWYQQ